MNASEHLNEAYKDWYEGMLSKIDDDISILVRENNPTFDLIADDLRDIQKLIKANFI